MGIKFSNNASSNITHALTADATSISITPGTGDLFPSIVEGKDYFYATLAGNNGLEIVKVTKRVLDTMTVERAQDNTEALLFEVGDLFELRVIAKSFEDIQEEAVHKSGEETIAGSKTFTSSLNVKRNDPALNLVHSAVTQGTKPEGQAEYWAVNFKDSAGTNIARIVNSLGSDLGNGNLEFSTSSYNGTTAKLRLRASIDGTTHLFAPSTPSGAAADEVVTVDYLSGEDANLVHKTGAETITGAKTFTSSLNVKAGNYDATSVPDSDQWGALAFTRDKNNVTFLILQTAQWKSSQANVFRLLLAAPDGTGTGKVLLTGTVNANGVQRLTAPTTPAGSTGQDIVTADYLLSTGTYSPTNLPWYDGVETIADFNTLTTPGRYHVRYDTTAINVPMAVNSQTDGILVVERIRSATSIATSARFRQTFYVFGGQAQSYRSFVRTGTLSSGAWKDWAEVMTSKGGTFTESPAIKRTNPYLDFIETDISESSNPSSTSFAGLRFYANEKAKTLTSLLSHKFTDGSVMLRLAVQNADNTGEIGYFNSLAIFRRASGECVAYAPTPPEGSNESHIATTAWVRSNAVLVESWHSGTSWYRKYSDGWIEQGGEGAVGRDVTITLHTPFSNTNYYATAMGHGGYAWSDNVSSCTLNYTTTSFTAITNQGDKCKWYACGY